MSRQTRKWLGALFGLAFGVAFALGVNAVAQTWDGGHLGDMRTAAKGGAMVSDIDMQGYLIYDSTDALELGTACTGGATGDVCTAGAMYCESNVDVTGVVSNAADALELGTACTAGATGDACFGADAYFEGQAGRTVTTTTLGSGVTTFVVTTEIVVLTGDAGTNTVATITGGIAGQYLMVQFVDGLVTITDTDAHTANTVDMDGTTSNYTGADDATVILYFDGTSWYEAGRSTSFTGDFAGNELTDSTDNQIDLDDPIDCNGELIGDSTDAVEIGTACTGGVSGDFCTGGIAYIPEISHATSIAFDIAGVNKISITATGIAAVGHADGGAVLGTNASATTPTLIPDRGSSGTGIGGMGVGNISIIGDNVELMKLVEGTPDYISFATPDFYGTNAAGPSMLNEAATSTNPTQAPNRADPDTGVAWTSADILSLTAGGVSLMTLDEEAATDLVTVNAAMTIAGGLATTNGNVTIANGATTFAVTTSFATVTGDGGGDEVIATITGGVAGMHLTILCVDALWTLTDTDAHSANTVDLNSAFVAADDEILELIYDGTSWYETSRSKDSETSLTLHGELFVTGGGALTIATTAVPYTVDTLGTGDVNGFTFTANATGAITAYSDGTGKVNVADASHGLVTGDVINIQDTTDYNGVWAITYIDDHNFSIPDTWVNDNGASNWFQGDRLVANTGSAGTYLAQFSATVVKGAGASQEFTIQGYINENANTHMLVDRELTSEDAGSISFGGIITVADADEIFLTITNNEGTNNITLEHATFWLLEI